MNLRIKNKVSENATPQLYALRDLGNDRTRLNEKIAGRAAGLTRNHLTGLNRHATAKRLGASPTGYYEKKAESVESSATGEQAIVSIATGGGKEAFARVLGEVQILPREGHKYLTVPAINVAYGRRAKEFGDLKFITFGRKGDADAPRALVKQTVTMVPGKRKPEIKQIENKVFYWLTPSVTLTKDRTLLPSDEAYLKAAEEGAGDYFAMIEAEAPAADEQGGLA